MTIRGTMLTLKYAAREMARVAGGSFVAIPSIAAFEPIFGAAALRGLPEEGL